MMGTSTNAYLFYGVDLGDESEVIDAVFGEDAEEIPDDIIEYLEERLKSEGLSELVKVDTHCHSEEPMIFLYAKKYTAWRGVSEEILDLDAEIPWYHALVKALKVLNLNEGKISWRLASYWG